MIKKVFILCSNSDEAGAPRHVEELVRGLQEEIHFFYFTGCRGPVFSRLKALGVSAEIFPGLKTGLNFIASIYALYSLVRQILRDKPDLLHLHSAKAACIGRLAGLITRTPVVVTVHGWSWRGFGMGIARAIWCVEYLLARLPVNRYILVNQALVASADSLRIPRSRISVIDNCVRDVLPQLIAIHKEKKCLKIIMPARVDRSKDHITLVRALVNVTFEFELILCGGGTDSKEFKKLIGSASARVFDSTKFLGEISNVAEVFSDCDIFVLCSNYEAFPLSIIEAFRAGLPVLATDVGGVASAVDEEVGSLIGVGDEVGWERALNRHQTFDVRSSKGRRARLRYIENYDVRQALSKVVELYNS